MLWEKSNWKSDAYLIKIVIMSVSTGDVSNFKALRIICKQLDDHARIGQSAHFKKFTNQIWLRDRPIFRTVLKILTYSTPPTHPQILTNDKINSYTV